MQRELAVEKREKELEEKLATTPADPFGSNIPDSEKTIEQLVWKEKQEIIDKLNAKKPRPPVMFY